MLNHKVVVQLYEAWKAQHKGTGCLIQGRERKDSRKHYEERTLLTSRLPHAVKTTQRHRMLITGQRNSVAAWWVRGFRKKWKSNYATNHQSWGDCMIWLGLCQCSICLSLRLQISTYIQLFLLIHARVLWHSPCQFDNKVIVFSMLFFPF